MAALVSPQPMAEVVALRAAVLIASDSNIVAAVLLLDNVLYGKSVLGV